ncbi:MAG: UvrB/UvrC motif-containing protein [Planctomycetota bacterium]
MAMKCEADNCENEATVHLTEIREGEKHEMHLCEACAATKGLPGKSHYTIQQLLTGIANQTQALSQNKTRRGKDPECGVCGTTLSQFQSSGRFGCPECYVAFKDDVQSLVEKIHDSTQHCGKVPTRTSSDVAMQKDLRQLQVDLKKAIRHEEYEQAAALRDRIRKIEDLMAAGGVPSGEDTPVGKKKGKSES